MWEVVSSMLMWMTALFLLVITAYYLVRIDKRSKKLHADFLRGTWQRQGKTEAGEQWYINYSFANGQFEIQAKPKYQLKGNYRIIKEVEKLLVLEFSNLSGDDVEEAPSRLGIGIDNRSNQIIIDNRIYNRIK